MEQHGENPRKNVFVIIPARLGSTRLAGKLLLEIAGKPLILHTIGQARKVRGIEEVLVATDSREIFEIVENAGAKAVMTSKDHQSGSDRLAEVARTLPKNSIIVNVQGDEPLIPPTMIELAVEAILTDETAQISTTCEALKRISDVLSPDVVKVVTDNDGFALYFSRSPIPFPREVVNKYGSLANALEAEPSLLSRFRKHTGLYVYRREYLLEFAESAQTKLEQTEMLEQLRALEMGARIKVVETRESSIGVDTIDDFEKVRSILENPQSGNIRNDYE